MEEETKRTEINKIIDDLGENFRNDEIVLKEILEEINSIAFNISNNKNKEQLFPYIKKAVKATYIRRGVEGMTSSSEGGESYSYEDIIEKLRSNIIKNGLRRLR